MAQFVMQMAGWMGTGKSTIAAAVAAATRAVVIDHDTTKTAILAAGVPHPPAGAASYEVVFAIVADLLAQGHSVIIDSPSVYPAIPERGSALASEGGATYFFVECHCSEALANERVGTRPRRSSQVASAAEASTIRADPDRVPHRPALGWLDLDTSRSIDVCVTEVLAHLDAPGASGTPVPSG